MYIAFTVCKNPLVKVTTASSAGVAAKVLSSVNEYSPLPLLTNDWIVYSVALPAIVNDSFTLGDEVNPSITTTVPDWFAPSIRGVPRWFKVEVVWQSNVVLSSSANFSNVYVVTPLRDLLAITIKWSFKAAIDWNVSLALVNHWVHPAIFSSLTEWNTESYLRV